MSNDKNFKDRMPKKKKYKNLLQRKQKQYNTGGGTQDRFTLFLSSLGNDKVTQLFEGGLIQAKLNMGHPDDIYEKEADKIAKEIIKGKSEKTPKISKIKSKPGAHKNMVDNEAGSKIKSLKGKGNPLSKSLRDLYEPRFGVDLGNVRVHTYPHANLLANSINAKAFTYGNDIVFNKGEYNPLSNRGKQLIAHELTHTMQQSGGVQRDIVQRDENYQQTRNFGSISSYKESENNRRIVYNRALSRGETSETSPYGGSNIGTVAFIVAKNHPEGSNEGQRDIFDATVQVEYIQLFNRTEEQWISFFNNDWNSAKEWELHAFMAAAIDNINLLAAAEANKMASVNYRLLPDFDYIEYVHYINRPDSDRINEGSKILLKAMLMSQELNLIGDTSFFSGPLLLHHYHHLYRNFIDIFPLFCNKYLYDVIKDLTLEELQKIDIDRFLQESETGRGYLHIIEACSRDVDNRYRKLVTLCNKHYNAEINDRNFNLEAIRYISEVNELGLLIGTSIKKIKDMGLERLDIVSDAISVTASIVATIVGGPLAAGVAIVIGYASDYFSEQEAVIRLFTEDERRANERFPDNDRTPRKKLEAIQRLIQRFIDAPNEQQLDDSTTVGFVGWAIADFMKGIYRGRLGERPRP